MHSLVCNTPVNLQNAGCNSKDTLDFSCKLYRTFYVFIIPSLGIRLIVFYQVDCEGEASSIAHVSFMYFCLLPHDGRMNI